MGSGASRAQGKAAAAAASGGTAMVSAAEAGDVRGGNAVPAGELTSAGGDVGCENSVSASSETPGGQPPDTAASKPSGATSRKQYIASESVAAQVKPGKDVEEVSSVDADKRSESVKSNTGQTVSGEVGADVEKDPESNVESPYVRDVACQSGEAPDNPEQPLDVPPPSPHQQHLNPAEPPHDKYDNAAAAVKDAGDHLVLRQNPDIPPADEGSDEHSQKCNPLPVCGGVCRLVTSQRSAGCPDGVEAPVIDKEVGATAAAPKDDKSADLSHCDTDGSPMCDVSVLDGPRGKVISVSHAGLVDHSDGLPPVQ